MRQSLTPQKQLGTPATYGRNTWVQTERKAHEAWAHLTATSPRASVLMHHLVARMGHQNAVVISQKTLAKLMGCTTRTVQNALADLVKGRWVQVVQVGPAGTVNAYVVNAHVAWGEARDQIGRLAVFTATVVADADDQPPEVLKHKELRTVSIAYVPHAAAPPKDDSEEEDPNDLIRDALDRCKPITGNA